MLLELRHIQKTFGGYAAVADIDMLVERGAIHAVIGPNGAGKTTLFNLITGVLAPTAGSICLDGAEIAGARPDRIAKLGIARTFQGVRLFRPMTALENVLIGRHCRTRGGIIAAVARLPWRESAGEVAARQRAEELLDMVGLAARRTTPAEDLALADQRRLEIARALAAEPKLLLLDEPVAGMNPVEVREAGALIRRIRAGGTTILLTEHHMSLVMEISDTVTVLNYGRKIAEGRPAAVRENPDVLEAYLGAEAAE